MKRFERGLCNQIHLGTNWCNTREHRLQRWLLTLLEVKIIICSLGSSNEVNRSLHLKELLKFLEPLLHHRLLRIVGRWFDLQKGRRKITSVFTLGDAAGCNSRWDRIWDSALTQVWIWEGLEKLRWGIGRAGCWARQRLKHRRSVLFPVGPRRQCSLCDPAGMEWKVGCQGKLNSQYKLNSTPNCWMNSARQAASGWEMDQDWEECKVINVLLHFKELPGQLSYPSAQCFAQDSTNYTYS